MQKEGTSHLKSMKPGKGYGKGGTNKRIRRGDNEVIIAGKLSNLCAFPCPITTVSQPTAFTQEQMLESGKYNSVPRGWQPLGGKGSGHVLTDNCYNVLPINNRAQWAPPGELHKQVQ